MNRTALRRRYHYLWTGEAAASLLFVGLFLYHALADPSWEAWLLRGYALAVLIFILVQGVFWWRWKLRVLNAERRAAIPAGVLRWYQRFKWLNWLLIALFPAVLWLNWQLLDGPRSMADLWIGLLILAGAVLEQINYYYYQLMYDNPYDWAYLRTYRRLRPGNIGQALTRLPA